MPKSPPIDLGYRARPQFRPFHARRQRWACIVAHRRAGKTVACIMDLIDAALRSRGPLIPGTVPGESVYAPSDARFAYLAPTYAQAKDAVWLYLKRFTANIPDVRQRESDLSVIFPNGARVRLYGAEFYDRLRGTYADGLVIDEYADINPRAWPEVLRPALADRKGWAVFIGTPKGRNDFWRVHQHAERHPDWFSLVLRASETGILNRTELDDMRQALTPEAYDQELECSFDAAILGAYYGRDLAAAEADGRIGAVPYDPAIPVHTAWDLGIGDSTAIWFFQIARAELHVIDHYEASGFALGHYADVLKAKPYDYGRDYLPHDAMAREMGTGRSIFETLKQLTGRHPFLVPKLSVMDGINATRVTIGRAWFDAAKCHDGLEALRAYRADYDEKNKVFADRPKHDWSSHCFHGDTKILTRHGTCPIMDLPETGEVLTPCGWNAYRNPRITLRNAPLVEVVFSDGHTVKCTPDHLFLTVNGWRSASDLRMGSLIQSTLTRSTSISMAAFIAYGRARCTMREAARGCIGTFGLTRSVLSRMVATFTIGMQTSPTTPSGIWNASPVLSICRPHGATRITQSDPGNISLRRLERRPPNGINPKRADFGTAATLFERRVGQNGSARQSPANSAPSRLRQLSERLGILVNSARSHVRLLPTEGGTKQSHKSVPFAAKSFWDWSGPGYIRSFAAKRARTLIVERVTPLTETADVWDITVPGVECFSLANGAVVHNSADACRYMSIAWREIAPDKPPAPPVDTWARAFGRVDDDAADNWRVA